MKILFISRWFPFPPNNGSKIRIFHLIKRLASHHEITLLSFYEPDEGEPDPGELGSFCKSIYTIPRKSFSPSSWRSIMGLFSWSPRSFVDTFSRKLVNRIADLINTQHFDLVIASQIDTAAYGKYFQGLPALFEEVESGTLYEQYIHADSILRRFRNGLTWFKYQVFLNKTLHYYQACTVVSEVEEQVLSNFVDRSMMINIIPNCVDIRLSNGVSEKRQKNTIIFTGSFTYEPNFEAMVWFTREVFPQILSSAPESQLVITGNHANRPLPNMEHVLLTGYIDDVRPYLAGACCSIVPILKGGGTRLKILEALALNTPVVSTSKGVEGLDFCHGEHLLIADSVQDFAEATIMLMSDQALRERLSKNARQRLLERYNWDVVMPVFLSIIEKIGLENHD